MLTFVVLNVAAAKKNAQEILGSNFAASRERERERERETDRQTDRRTNGQRSARADDKLR